MRNQWKKHLWDLGMFCGLCIAVASSVVGQDLKSETRSNRSQSTQPVSKAENGTSNFNNPNSGQPSAATTVKTINGQNVFETFGNSQFPTPIQAQYGQNSYGPNSQFYQSHPAGTAIHSYFAPQSPELMIYQDGQFSVVTQNVNDPKTQENYRNTQKLLMDAVQALRSENSSEEKRAEAKELLGNFLGAHFEHDQKKRKDQLQALEQQVAKLKSQLEKRSQSKDQLVELRLKLMENDASGLSFPQSWNNLGGMENPVMVNPVGPHNNYAYPHTTYQPGVGPSVPNTTTR
jgi:hypothetical protein